MEDKYLLASDIDNTLTGDRAALDELAEILSSLRKDNRLTLFLSTGRRLEQVMDGFEKEGIPEGDAVISLVGTEIFLPPFHRDRKPLAEWDKKLKEGFSRKQGEEFLVGIDGLEMQPEIFNTPLKVSCFLDKSPDPEAAAREIRERVAEHHGDYQVVWSSGKDLDIIPASAGKGKAISFLIDYLGLKPKLVVTAGDSGNDWSMMDEFSRGIVVNNAKPELKSVTSNDPRDGFYFARASYAAGVKEGLAHFGII
jgi:sucrose-6-phosphatase